MAMRAGPMPNAQPVYRSLSTPDASSTLGCTIPDPRISIQPVPLHAGHPAPPQMPHCTSISGRLGEREERRTKARACRPEEPARELVQRRFEVHEADALVHAQSFDLHERGRMRCVEEVAPIRVAGNEHTNGRLEL